MERDLLYLAPEEIRKAGKYVASLCAKQYVGEVESGNLPILLVIADPNKQLQEYKNLRRDIERALLRRRIHCSLTHLFTGPREGYATKPLTRLLTQNEIDKIPRETPLLGFQILRG